PAAGGGGRGGLRAGFGGGRPAVEPCGRPCASPRASGRRRGRGSGPLRSAQAFVRKKGRRAGPVRGRCGTGPAAAAGPERTGGPGGGMGGICEGRVVLVTGAGRGLGRAHALEFARQGARVVVNDVGVEPDGSGRSAAPAEDVAAEIRAAGGEAATATGDIAAADGAAEAVDTALRAFGRLDTLVNNAGFVRDRMLVNLSEEEWDAVLRVHLKGH